MDDKVVKDVLDGFENDEFIDSREKLRAEIHKTRNEFLKTKLGLEKDIDPQIKSEPRRSIIRRNR
jgi:hypothetical protein